MKTFVSTTEFCSRNKLQKINENLAQRRAVPALERLLIKRKRALSFMQLLCSTILVITFIIFGGS